MTNYFVGENIFTFNSGTEFGQIKRLKMFERQGMSAKIVTRDYNQMLSRDAKDLGLKKSDVVNMYDWFQGVTNVNRKELDLRLLEEIPKDKYKIDSIDPNQSSIFHEGVEIARAQIMPGTIGLVNTITYLDRRGNKTSREVWDWRGFKTSIEYFHPDGHIGLQQILNRKGKPVIEVNHMNVKGKLMTTMWKLLDYKGKDYRFNFEDQMFLFFLNELAAEDGNAVFFSDRRSLDYVVAEVSAKKKWLVFHDSHLEKAGSPKTAPIFEAYKPALENLTEKVNGILVPTKKQADDINSRFPKARANTAADTVAQPNAANQRRVKRDDTVLFVGRLSPEKSPEKAIEVFAKVKKMVPNAKMQFAGFPNSPDYQARLQEKAKATGFEDDIEFLGYVQPNDLRTLYGKAKVLLVTSAREGLGMQVVEAFDNGLPVVSFDYRYGANDLINDENGAIVGNSTGLAANIIANLLTNEEEWSNLHEGTKKSILSVSEEVAARQWRRVAD